MTDALFDSKDFWRRLERLPVQRYWLFLTDWLERYADLYQDILPAEAVKGLVLTASLLRLTAAGDTEKIGIISTSAWSAEPLRSILSGRGPEFAQAITLVAKYAIAGVSDDAYLYAPVGFLEHPADTGWTRPVGDRVDISVRSSSDPSNSDALAWQAEERRFLIKTLEKYE